MRGRSLRTWRLTGWAAAGWVAVGVLSLGATAWAASEQGSDASAAVSLMNDSAGHPLFSAQPRLVPGQPRSACLTVAAADAGPDDQVRLLTQDLTGSLAGRLQLDVYLGSGGGYGDCTGFTGSLIYHGTVAGLADSGASGIGSGWKPGRRSMRSFKFVVTLSSDNAGQGARAGATFVWRLDSGTGGSSPTPSPSPTPVVTPSPLPGGSGSGGTSSNPGGSGGSGGTGTGGSAGTSPGGSTGGAGTGSGRGSGTGSGAGRGSGSGSKGHHPAPVGPDLTLAPSITSQVGRTVIDVLARPQYSICPLLVALCFMLVQHRIDARDPKLVNASRTWRDLTVPFPLSYPPRPPGRAGGEVTPS